MQEPEYEPMPSVPVTGDALAARWASRDAEYAKERVAMDPAQVEAIRIGRQREANGLPNIAERARMWGRASIWEAPVHPEFGGLQDFLHD